MQDLSLILASASPQRRNLLAATGVAFAVEVSAVIEPPWDTRTPPEEWAQQLATLKAQDVAARNPNRLVLGADTIVSCMGQVLGKPVDADDARRMLHLQAGRETDVITGYCLVRGGDHPMLALGHVSTRVWMRNDRDRIEAYVASGDWAGKAGAYGIQSKGDKLVERVDGSFSNVVGLPTERILDLFRQFGIAFTDADGG